MKKNSSESCFQDKIDLDPDRLTEIETRYVLINFIFKKGQLGRFYLFMIYSESQISELDSDLCLVPINSFKA